MSGRTDISEAVLSDRRFARLRDQDSLAASDGRIVASCLARVANRPVAWLWGELVARGMVTSLTGPSGVGKTFVALDVAAAVTRGDRKTLRKCSGPSSSPAAPSQGDVLLISTSYELREIARARLVAAKAEMPRVHIVYGIRPHEGDAEKQTAQTTSADCGRINSARNPDRDAIGLREANLYCPFQLNHDLPLLEQEIERRKDEGSPVSLIIIDPFPFELVDDRFDAAQLNSTIQQLAEIAATTDIAILLVVNCPEKPRATVTHNIKDLESTVSSAWWIGVDPYRPERRLLLPVKMNLIERSPARAFLITNGCVQWDARPIWLNAERFQAETRERVRLPLFEQDFSELANAMNWLSAHLQTTVQEYKIIKTAAAFVGISERTLRRAFCGLKGLSWRIPGTNSWAWKLRDGDVINPHLPWSVDPFVYDENAPEEDDEAQSPDDVATTEESRERESTAAVQDVQDIVRPISDSHSIGHGLAKG